MEAFQLRLWDGRIGRWLSPDPYGQYASPYLGMGNNPIGLVDPDGGSTTSTHTDKNGNVVAVYNDGDLGVYKHSDKEISAWNNNGGILGGGQLMGRTLFWDEFTNINSKLPEGQIQFGQKWDSTVRKLHSEAMEMDLKEIGNNSKSSTKDKIYKFDIKENKEYAPFGPMTGKLLGGYYASARSAGNYLAGWNGLEGTLFGMHLNQFEYMNLAGAYQQKMYKGYRTAVDIVIGGKTFGKKPYYGEQPYSGRMILVGWNSND